jgi:protein-S-isoprenylcysteine O-methyltransferase Ste14
MRTSAERLSLWALAGTVVFASTFVAFVLIYVPYLITRWHFAAPLLGLRMTRVIGVLLMALAIPLMLDFFARFVRDGRGTPAPFAPPRRLVVSGPFKRVRNPAYIAGMTFVIGQGLLFGSWEVLAYAGVFAIISHLFVVLYEEPTLRATFGANYEAYCRAVPRWLPRLRGTRGE